jgi:adapter protein MecA 1/2
MKIEKVNENIIKVTISLVDLEERNIDLSSLNYNSPAAQELFWDMMEQAEIQFGFTASDSQLVFEASPDSGEGFVVTITKLDEDGDFESIQKYIKSKFRNSDLRVKKKNRRICSTILIYTFASFEDVSLLCRKLGSTYTGDSILYKCRDTYYMVFTRTNHTAANMKIFDSLLSEYGTKITNTGFYEGYLSEYGEKIIEYNAIEVINNYFNKKPV